MKRRSITIGLSFPHLQSLEDSDVFDRKYRFTSIRLIAYKVELILNNLSQSEILFELSQPRKKEYDNLDIVYSKINKFSNSGIYDCSICVITNQIVKTLSNSSSFFNTEFIASLSTSNLMCDTFFSADWAESAVPL